MIFTTNRSLKAQGRVLHDDDVAQAIIDCVLERGRLRRLDGPSIRTLHVNLDEAMKEDSDEETDLVGISEKGGQNFRNPHGAQGGRTSEEREGGYVFKPGVVILSAVSLAAGMTWAAGNPFVGRWKLVPSKSRMPDEMKVQRKSGNTYAFDLGGGVETIVVDGSDQPGFGGSRLSVKAQAPDTWIVKRKRGGRLLLKATWKLSSDGSTLRDYYRQFESDGSTTSLDFVYRRTGGGSGFAGDWQSIKETINSPFLMEVKQSQGDGLSIADPVERRTKNLTLDGRDYPKDRADAAANAGRGLSSSLRRVDERTLVVTDEYNGKAMVTEELVLSADSKVLTMTVHTAGHEQPYVLVFERTASGKRAAAHGA